MSTSRHTALDSSSDWARHWCLDPSVIFLNHGSYGACPRGVLEAQREFRDRIERDPMQFFKRDLEPLLDDAVNKVSAFVVAAPEQLAFVPNTTTGVNTVLRALSVRPGDELLTTTHAYNACSNALEFAAQRAGARVIKAEVPFPIQSPEQVLEPIVEAITPKTRLALLDHVTSSTGLIFPLTRLIRELNARGIESLVDGAHAPGMLDLDLRTIGATYYVGNCHKWLCAPKGAAFLYVSPDRQSLVRPLVISHGANSPRTDRSRFRLEFDWTGTDDPSSYLSVPVAIQLVGSLLPGGWPVVQERNRSLVLEARRLLCHALKVQVPCPDEMIGSLAAIPLPSTGEDPPRKSWSHDPLQEALYTDYRIEVPVSAWPDPSQRLLRISAHLYNDPSQYASLVRALRILRGR